MVKAAAGDENFGTVARVVRLLRAVAESSEFSLSQMAAVLELPPSTIHRLLNMLVGMDIVERGEKGSYRAGREFYRISSLVSSRFDFNAVAHPFLVRMAQQLNETCSFAIYMPVLRAGTIVDTIPSGHSLQYVIAPFTQWSLAWGALGRVMLAHLSEDDARAAVAAAVPSPATGQPVPSWESLAAELTGIRILGHYISSNQNVLGATGTAAPVFARDGKLVGSLGIAIPIARYRSELQPSITALVMENAAAVSAALGFRGRQQALAAGPTVSA